MAQVMRNANKLLQTLQAGKGPSFGAWQMLPGTNISRVIARQGFDWVCVDCEHGNIAGMHSSLLKLAVITVLSSVVQTMRCMKQSLP